MDSMAIDVSCDEDAMPLGTPGPCHTPEPCQSPFKTSASLGQSHLSASCRLGLSPKMLLSSPKACSSPSRAERKARSMSGPQGTETGRSWTSVMGFEELGQGLGQGKEATPTVMGEAALHTSLESFATASDGKVYSAPGDANARRARGKGIVVRRCVTLLPNCKFIDETTEKWKVPEAMVPRSWHDNHRSSSPPLAGSKVWCTTGTYRVLNDLPLTPGETRFVAALELAPAQQLLTHTIITERVMTMPGGPPYMAELTGDDASASMRIDPDATVPGPQHLEQEVPEPPCLERASAFVF